VKFGVRVLIIVAVLAGCAGVAPRDLPAYRQVVDPAESAQATAELLLHHLAAGDIEAAAALSNAPERRAQVLRDYRASVGEAEFRRIFAEYAKHRLVREIALGERRLLMWDLDNQLGAQYFVRDGNRFLIDDVPNAERTELRRVLLAYRQGRIKPSAGKD